MQARDRFELLPLRQMVMATGEAAPAFARQGLLDWLSRSGRYQIFSHGSGGQIMAAGERALTEAQAVLQQAYGPCIAFGAPTVHSFVDIGTETLMVPVIFMRIDAPRSHARELRELLTARCAKMGEVEQQRERVVFRLEMTVSRSLGAEREILDVCRGAAHILTWLLRYERASRTACASNAAAPAYVLQRATA
jgi:hypothetical protein